MTDIEDACVIVGRQHGTAFYFCGDEPAKFLDMIEKRHNKEHFEAYLAGFMEGLQGAHKNQYGYLK